MSILHFNPRPNDPPCGATTLCGLLARVVKCAEDRGQVTCYDCHRIDLDDRLREIGAHVIRVADLGPALEANEQGRHAAFVAGLAMEGRAGLLYLPKTRPIVAVFPSYVYEVAKEAAHLARLALGEG